MLTRLKVKNFKRFESADVELGRTVVFIGPNNSGKTTALQALALWEVGLRQWTARRGGKASPEKRPGVAINRRDLISIPVPNANLIWKDLHVRQVTKVEGKTHTRNIRVEITLEGVTEGEPWSCGLEFDYSNEESFVCRPARLAGFSDRPVKEAQFTKIPEAALKVRFAFLPPMSGLAAAEPKWEPGRVNVLLGEGQTAQVLRNLCFQIYERGDGHWDQMVSAIDSLFGVSLNPPVHIMERGEITMDYQEAGSRLDLSSSGRGLQQTLLLLAHLHANPSTVLLLDEPDAHLEILRQRQIYQIITSLAERQGSQVIAASHSEVVLNEAADRDVVVAFVGQPHRIDDRGSQVAKSLKDIGFEDYYLAEEKGWVLYLEGSTDLAILRAFAETLGHEAARHLERPFFHAVGNQVSQIRRHFWGLKEAKPDLVGIAILDNRERPLPEDLGAEGLVWQRREIENYLCSEEVLLAYARYDEPDDLFALAESQHREESMRAAIERVSTALETLRGLGPFSPQIKATDDFLDPLFETYFKALGLPNLLRKSDYHELARLVPAEDLDPEITAKLDAIVTVAEQATPVSE